MRILANYNTLHALTPSARSLEQAGIDISFDAPSKTWIPNTTARNVARGHTIPQSHDKAPLPVAQPERTQSRFASLFAQMSTNVIQPTQVAHNSASTDISANTRSSHKIIPGAVRFPKRAGESVSPASDSH